MLGQHKSCSAQVYTNIEAKKRLDTQYFISMYSLRHADYKKGCKK